MIINNKFINKLLSSFLVLFCFAFTVTSFQDTTSHRKSANTKGGYGGKIIRVTNLNSSGSGSFYEAVRTKGKRIVVFEVAGIIDLKGKLVNIRDPFLTIAGQTAPSPGVTLINGGVIITTHDVIVQHMRIRTGTNNRKNGNSSDALSTSRAYNIIIDHCSLSWSSDENLSASGPRFEGGSADEWRKNTSHLITFSNNIIAEGLSHSVHRFGEHSKGTLIHDNVTDVLIVGNLYANNVDRNPYLKGGTSGVVLNNYIFNPGKAAIRYMLAANEWQNRQPQVGKWSIVGNIMQHGRDSENIAMLDIRSGPAKIYLEDNISKRIDGSDGEIVSGERSKLVDNKPIWFEGLDVIKGSNVKDYIVKNVGARPWDRDDHDKRIIQSVLNKSGRIINTESDVGGYPQPTEKRQVFKQEEWNLRTMERVVENDKMK